MLFFRFFFFYSLFLPTLWATTYYPSNESPSPLTREFRGVWVASVYNLDWPSSKTLSASAQKRELLSILQMSQKLHINAIIFQVRPNGDALYSSSLEPWSHWLTGKMGRFPGYDPLAFLISNAHQRGIEVHAWFNPFRALPNTSIQASSQHISRIYPSLMRKFKTFLWADPSSPIIQQRTLSVILDVTRRYDIDGVHIDDYFYPYPSVDDKGRAFPRFPDGKTPSQRRTAVNTFVKNLYYSVKRVKPWVRVGISPFGIWKPGVPSSTTARISAYEHLAADSRKWLRKGWCDYMSPQLYWRINSPQSFSSLLTWWRAQSRRPIWPGIATERIYSKEDPSRPASEIINQILLSRSIDHNWVGHLHWSAKALMQNRGGIRKLLASTLYLTPALVPPMPWLSKERPPSPSVHFSIKNKKLSLKWTAIPQARKYAIQIRYKNNWITIATLPSQQTSLSLDYLPDAIAIYAISAYGMESFPLVLTKKL